MIIQVFCNICRSSYVFHNRCRYLEHRRRHTEDSRRLPTRGRPIYKDVQVMALQGPAMEQALDQWLSSTAFQRLGNLFALCEEEFGPVSLELKKLLQTPGPCESQSGLENRMGTESEARSQNLPPPQLRRIQSNVNGTSQLEPPVRKQMRLDPSPAEGGDHCWCTECQAKMGNSEDLKRHFVYNLPPNQKQFICQCCSAVYFSLCSFSAHKRTHLNKSGERVGPYTCAECGLQQATPKALASHLLNHRSAPTILNAWRCQKCFTFYSNWNTLVVHFATAHSEYYFRCPKCPTAFQGFQPFDEHRKRTHPSKDPIQPEAAPKCPQCDGIFQNKDQLIDHLKGHLNKLTPFKVFRCPICGRLMENKSGLLAHYARSHGVHMKPQDVLEFPFQFDEVKPPSTSHFVKIAPKTNHPDAASSATPPTSESPRYKSAAGYDVSKHTKPKVLPDPGFGPVRCSRCPSEMGNDGLFANQFMLQMHIKAKHGDDRGAGPIGQQQYIGRSSRSPMTSLMSQMPPVSSTTGFFHHQTSSKGVNQSGAAMKGGYACKKYGCFFVGGTKHEMRGHAAAEHRDGQHFLCLECGLSFISEDSLKRHLISSHHIVDPVRYVKDYEDCLPLMSKTGTKCGVCGESFQSETELQIHARKHGMMFLQRSVYQTGGRNA